MPRVRQSKATRRVRGGLKCALRSPSSLDGVVTTDKLRHSLFNYSIDLVQLVFMWLCVLREPINLVCSTQQLRVVVKRLDKTNPAVFHCPQPRFINKALRFG